MKLINYGHSCFLIVSEKHRILFDPYKNGSVPNLLIRKPIECDYLSISHDHFDHSGRENAVLSSSSDINVEKIQIAHDHHGGAHRGMNIITLLNVEGITIAHLGDIGFVPSISSLIPLMNIDVLLAPINGFYTISSKELDKLCSIINPKLIIPMHFYNKIHSSGYDDGGQIDELKELIKDYIEVNETEIDISDYLNKTKMIIFKNSEGDIL